MGEGRQEISPSALIQSIEEALSNIRPHTRTDQNRIAMAKKNLREIKRSFRKMQEQINVLEEQLHVLEEVSTMAGGSVEGHVAGAFGDMSKENEKEKKRTKR